jgi:hypothetical protein
MSLQLRWDLYHAQQEETTILNKNQASAYALRAPRIRTFAVGLRSMAILIF